MPIQYPVGNIPFLESYIPFEFSEGVIACDYVKDMFSYNLVIPEAPPTIKYYVGAEFSFVADLEVKNLTDSAKLDFSIEYDGKIFAVKQKANGVYDNPIKLVIEPEEVVSFVIEINKDELNTNSNYDNVLSVIKLSVENIQTGKLVTKKLSVTTLPEVTLPTNVIVD